MNSSASKYELNRATGFTLVETLVAMTILLVAFMLVFNLFHATLRYGSMVEKQVFASVIATRKLEEIRKWSGTHLTQGYNYDTDWSYYSGVSSPDTENPDYTVKVAVRNASLRSPSTAYEASNPSDQKGLGSSCRKVKVTVSWDPLNPSKSLSLTSLVKDPVRTLRASNPLVVTPKTSIAGSLVRDGEFSFSADIYDADNLPVKDALFMWYAYPMDGNGTVTQARNGSLAAIYNFVYAPDPVLGTIRKYTGGTCKVMVRAVYAGVEKTAYSDTITLAP